MSSAQFAELGELESFFFFFFLDIYILSWITKSRIAEFFLSDRVIWDLDEKSLLLMEDTKWMTCVYFTLNATLIMTTMFQIQSPQFLTRSYLFCCLDVLVHVCALYLHMIFAKESSYWSNYQLKTYLQSYGTTDQIVNFQLHSWGW
jgi:hypothetical protein